MSEIKIDLKAKIPDDSECCGNFNGEICRHLHPVDMKCYIFFEPDNEPKDILITDEEDFLKCDECKTAHQKALKEKEVQKCPNCKEEISPNLIRLLSSCPLCEFEFPYEKESVCYECGKPRKHSKVDPIGFICPCPHCGDEIPF